ncbi:amino acid aminotransferase [Pannonibacter phragmitetus]|uniref:amino acid aminotransferase n=1 Tax=Pannonibacter phragmitetus TaxID=121719 RepID=UPI003D2EF505
MLEALPTPPVDPILALGGAVRSDRRSDKLDLGIGVFRDEAGHTPIMQAVREAERRLLDDRTTKTYVGARGDLRFADAVAQLILGTGRPERLTGIQATGGTGALRVLAGLVARARRDVAVWVPEPTWLNHQTIFADAGLKTAGYPYYDRTELRVRPDLLLAKLETIPAGDVVLFHGCCHNPCGADLPFEAWEAIAEVMGKRGLIPFVDLAYQGFGRGLDEDAAGVRLLAAKMPELLIAFSCSKNFGLYSERTGCALVLAENEARARLAGEHMALVARPLYSMPPDHGSAIVRTILEDAELAASWRIELSEMTQSILDNRRALAAAFRNATGTTGFDYLENGSGMFSLLNLSPGEILTLREERGIYIVEDGRINVAGLPTQRVTDFVHAVTDALARRT